MESLLEEIKRKLEEAEANQTKSAMLCVMMIVHGEELSKEDPHEIAKALGLSVSWSTLIRGYLKARVLLLEEGYQIKRN